MLRVSSETAGLEANLDSVVEGEQVDSKLPGGDALLQFAEVALGDDAEAIGAARQRVSAALGEAATVDAAGVIANFQRMVRIADATGIPLDEPMAVMSQQIRKKLGIDDYSSASHTPALSVKRRLLATFAGPFLGRLMARRFRSASK